MVSKCCLPAADKLPVTTDFIFSYFLCICVPLYACTCQHSCANKQVLAPVCVCVCVFRLTAMCQTDRTQSDWVSRGAETSLSNMPKTSWIKNRWQRKKGWKMSRRRQEVWKNPNTHTHTHTPNVFCFFQTTCIWLSAYKLYNTPKHMFSFFVSFQASFSSTVCRQQQWQDLQFYTKG